MNSHLPITHSLGLPDFKVIAPITGSAGRDRKVRSTYRQQVVDSLLDAGFTPVGDVLVGNESRFFAVSLDYSGMQGNRMKEKSSTFTIG
jgi:hypothetical protein